MCVCWFQRDEDSAELAELQTLLSVRNDRVDEEPYTQAQKRALVGGSEAEV